MHDIKEIAANPEEFKRRLATRHDSSKPEDKIDLVVALYEDRKKIVTNNETIQASLNKLSDQIGTRKRAGESAADLLSEVATLKAGAETRKENLKKIDHEIFMILAVLPNLPKADVPIGTSEDDNQVLKIWPSIDELVEEFDRQQHEANKLVMMIRDTENSVDLLLSEIESELAGDLAEKMPKIK